MVKGRHLLGGAVLLLFWPLVALFCLLLVVGVAAQVALQPPWWARLLILLVLGAFAGWLREGFRDMREAARADKDEGFAEVPREQAPLLWGLVDDVATTVGAPRVDRLHLTPIVNAAARIDDDGARRLYLGLPLLAALTHGSLRALVAHELAHLAHDADEPRWFRRAADRVGYAEAATGPVRWVALLVGGLYALVTGRAARAAELRADLWTLTIASREDAVAALHATARANVAWDQWGDLVLTPAAAGRVRAPLTSGFAELLATAPSDIERFAREEMDERPPRGSSHPSPSERVAALLAMPGPASPARSDPRPALDLVDQQGLLDIEGRLMALGPLPVVDLAEAVHVNGAAALVEAASDCASEACLGSYDDLLAAAARGEAFSVLMVPVLPLSPSEQADRSAALADGQEPDPDNDEDVYATAQVVAVCLVETAGARVVLSWPDHVLISADGDPLELNAPLAAAERASLLDVARALVAEHGGDLSVAPGGRLAIPESSLEAASGSTGPWDGDRDLVVLRGGLLALPAPEGWKVRSIAAELGRLGRLTVTDPDVLRARPDAWWLPLADIASARCSRGRWHLTRADGEEVVVRVSRHGLDTSGMDAALDALARAAESGRHRASAREPGGIGCD